MTSCPRLGKLIGGCKFRPRYDLGAPDIDGVKVRGTDLSAFLDGMKPKTYIHDICETCGTTVRRPS